MTNNTKTIYQSQIYNKDDTFYCETCKKTYNIKYKQRHLKAPRHLKLLNMVDNKEKVFEEKKAKDINKIIKKYGLEEVKSYIDACYIKNYMEEQDKIEIVLSKDFKKKIKIIKQ